MSYVWFSMINLKLQNDLIDSLIKQMKSTITILLIWDTFYQWFQSCP